MSAPPRINAQVNKQDEQNTRVDNSKTQEKQKEGIKGATAVLVASTSNQPVTVAAEGLTREQKPPDSHPQPISDPIRVPPPTAQVLPTPLSAPSAAPAPSTSAFAPSKTKSMFKPNPDLSATTTFAPPITRPVPSQRTVAPSPRKTKASVEPAIKQEEDEDDEGKFRETFAVWDLRKQSNALQTPKKKKAVINLGMVFCSFKGEIQVLNGVCGLVTPSSTASPLKGKEKVKSAELDSSLESPPPSDLEPLFLPSSPSARPRSDAPIVSPSTDMNKTPSSYELIKGEGENDDQRTFVWGPPPGTNRAYVEVPIVDGRGYARRKNKNKSKDNGKRRIKEWEEDVLEGV